MPTCIQAICSWTMTDDWSPLISASWDGWGRRNAVFLPKSCSASSLATTIARPKYILMAKLLMLLFEVTGLFDMRTRPELLLLQKTMVVVEGVARSLDPKLDMWTVAEPVVREWIERNLGPTGRLEDAAEGVMEVGRFLGDAPKLLARGALLVEQLDEITRDGLVLAPDTVAAIGRAEARRTRWTTAALWIIAALLAGLVYLMAR